MKKFLAISLACVSLCSLLFGCSKPQTATPATEPTVSLRDESMPKKLLVSDVTNIPIATDDMTYAERRQLCLDFFEVQVGFQWKPDMDVTDWITTNYNKGTYKQLLTSDIYGGIPYQSKGSGNLYRWLEYYDETTGIMNLEAAFAENGGYGDGAAIFDEEKDNTGAITYKKYRSFQTLFNQCSVSAYWGWGRVINSANFGYTNEMTAYNGFIPVGCYDYGYDYEGKHYDMHGFQYWGKVSDENPKGLDVDDVIVMLQKEKGAEGVYKLYAQMKPADCLVNTGHVIMVKSVNLFTTKSGEIDYELSTVTVLEQVEGWAAKDTIGDTKLWQQGYIDHAYTFSKLLKENYIPFTFEELLDPNDPQDKKHLDYFATYKDKITSVPESYSAIAFSEEMIGAGVEKGQVYSTLDRTEGSIRFAEFYGMSVAANYGISDVFVTVTDKDGKVLAKNIFRATDAHTREVSMLANKSTWETTAGGALLDLTDGIKELATGENTIEISLQISTGEKLTAFKGTLTQ